MAPEAVLVLCGAEVKWLHGAGSTRKEAKEALDRVISGECKDKSCTLTSDVEFSEIEETNLLREAWVAVRDYFTKL